MKKWLQHCIYEQEKVCASAFGKTIIDERKIQNC